MFLPRLNKSVHTVYDELLSLDDSLLGELLVLCEDSLDELLEDSLLRDVLELLVLTEDKLLREVLELLVLIEELDVLMLLVLMEEIDVLIEDEEEILLVLILLEDELVEDRLELLVLIEDRLLEDSHVMSRMFKRSQDRGPGNCNSPV